MNSPAPPGLPGRCGHALFGIYAFVVLLLLVVLGWLTAWFVPGLPRRRRLIRAYARALFRLTGIPLHTAGWAHLHATRPCIVVANHTSNLDVIALIAVLPEDIRFVAKREFEGNPLTSALMKAVGTVFIERQKHYAGHGSTRLIQRWLDQGESLIIFPEGTFYREPGLQPFRMGAFVAAAHTDTPVVPVAVRGARTILPARSLLARPGTITMMATAPLLSDGPDWIAAERLRDAAYRAIQAACGEPALALPGRVA